MSDPSLIWSKPDREVWIGNSLNEAHVAAIMGDRKADLLCVDAPYSEKTHAGHDAGKPNPEQLARYAERAATPGMRGDRAARIRYEANRAAEGEGRRKIDYPPWTPADVDAFVALWSPLTAGWFVTITDDVLAPAWKDALDAAGRLTFPALPLVETGSRVRTCGDGPSNWTCWIIAARPRGAPWNSWGTLRGAYVVPGERNFNRNLPPARVVGGKNREAMEAIVADYSRPGALVVDPCSGGGTTLRAAIRQGRRCLGIDSDAEHAQLSAWACGAERPVGQQGALFG